MVSMKLIGTVAAVGGAILWSGRVSFNQVVGGVFLVVGASVASLYYGQENLLYQPRVYPQYIRPQDNPPSYRHPSEHDFGEASVEDVELITSDQVRVEGWFIRQVRGGDRPTVIFFQGNAASRLNLLQGVSSAIINGNL